LKFILEKISDNPRGIIDIFGLFINYDNSYVCEKIHSMLTNKHIIFLDKNHNTYVYSPNKQHKKYNAISDDNFYYYDQCHYVGVDISQPQRGHGAVIISKHTRMTDFAQGIFRFRKINRGTIISIILVDDDDISEVTNINDVYRLLSKNEHIFNSHQEFGLKCQLLKTVCRNYTGNYTESDLTPEFLRKEKIDSVKYFDNFVRKASNMKDSFYMDLYKFITSDKLKLDDFLINRSTQINVSIEKDEYTAVDTNKYTTYGSHQSVDTTINIIVHSKCKLCEVLSCTILFKKLKINEKLVYISRNLGCVHKSNEFISIKYTNNATNLVFVEFESFMLLELKVIGINYYIDKFPVYDYNGYILLPLMAHDNNFELQFDDPLRILFNSYIGSV
jgi:hypothetical protein